MHPGDIVQFLLLVLVIIFAILGNGSVCCLLFRFKSLRTIPNLLVLDLSIVDGLNAVINASLFIAYFVMELEILRGKILAELTEASYRCFLFLNLTTKLLLMLDRYFVITHGIRYTVWKSRSKVCLIIFIKWMFCLAISSGSCSALWEIDLGDAQVLDYRGEYLETNGRMIKRLMILIIHGLYLCLTIATFRVVRKANKEFREDIGQKTQAALINANNISKVKASKTIVMLVACDFVFYLPMVLYFYIALTPGFEHHGWFPFFAHYFAFISSVNNPMIYFSRTQRFRLALLKMLRDPCGPNELFEFRTLPGVRLVPQRRHNLGTMKRNTALTSKPKRRHACASLDFEMQSAPAIKPATLHQEHPELVECALRTERKRMSEGQRSAPIDDHPLDFVHRTSSDDDGAAALKRIHPRQVNVILSNRRSGGKGKCCVKEDDGNKRGTDTDKSADKSTDQSAENSPNYPSSMENTNTQESDLSSEMSHDSYDTWL